MKCHDPNCEAQLNWFRDRILKRPGYYLESRWYCSELCLARAVARALEKRSHARDAAGGSPFQLKLEHVLIANGAISRDQLVAALKQPFQDLRGGLGRHLLSLGFVNERDLKHAYSRLFNIPVINLTGKRVNPKVLNLIPVEIVKNHHFVPVEIEVSDNRIDLATYDPLDLSVMVNLRGILNCEVSIYLSDESVVRNLMDQYCRLSSETVEKPEANAIPDSAREAARRIAQRAKAIEAQSLQVCRLDQFIWTRFTVGHTPFNFVLPDSQAV